MSNNDDVDIGFDPLAWMNASDSGESAEKITEPSEQKIAPEAAAIKETAAAKGDDAIQAEPINAAPEKSAPSTGNSRIDLAGKVDIASATELKQELSNALNQDGPITFAAADVSRADGAGLQLLTSFVRELDGINREIIWDEPSEQLIDAANIVGLKEALHLP